MIHLFLLLLSCSKQIINLDKQKGYEEEINSNGSLVDIYEKAENSGNLLYTLENLSHDEIDMIDNPRLLNQILYISTKELKKVEFVDTISKCFMKKFGKSPFEKFYSNLDASCGSLSAFCEKSLTMLFMGLNGEHFFNEVTIRKLSDIYFRCEALDSNLSPISKFFIKFVRFLKEDFLLSLQETAINNFFERISFYSDEDIVYIKRILVKFLETKSREKVRKYCKKVNFIFSIKELATFLYKNVAIFVNIDELQSVQDLFNLFQNGSPNLKNESNMQMLNLLSDVANVDNLQSMALYTGDLIHQYVVINYKDYFIEFIKNLTDSMDGVDASIFTLRGFSGEPNFGIIALKYHGIQMLKKIETEFLEKLGKDFTIFINEDNVLSVLLVLFKRGFIDFKENAETRKLLSEYCIKLFEKYKEILFNENFDLFSSLYNELNYELDEEDIMDYELVNYFYEMKNIFSDAFLKIQEQADKQEWDKYFEYISKDFTSLLDSILVSAKLRDNTEIVRLLLSKVVEVRREAESERVEHSELRGDTGVLPLV